MYRKEIQKHIKKKKRKTTCKKPPESIEPEVKQEVNCDRLSLVGAYKY